MDQGSLGFPDAKFWDVASDDEERIVDELSEGDFLGLVLDAPQELRLAEHDDLPMVGARVSSIRDNIMVSLQRRAVIVATHPERDEVLAATAFRINDDARRPPTPKNEASIRKGRTAKAFQIALNDRVELAWKPGTLHGTLLLFDQRSNTTTTRLLVDESRDPAVREYLASQRRPAYPPAVTPPAEFLPNAYRADDNSPPLPAEAGIALSCERVVLAKAGAHCVLRGSFRLPVRERDAVRPAPAAEPGEDAELIAREAGWIDVGDPDARAVLPIAILLTGDTVADPILTHLRVPVYGSIVPGESDAPGHFAVDLFGITNDPLPVQSYAVWAISRAIVSEPTLVGIVTEDMLPPPGES